MNKIDENNFQTHRLNETHAAGHASQTKRLTRKKRRGGTSDSIGKAKKKDGRFLTKKGGDNILDGHGPADGGSYQSHGGLYFPGPGLMAYALRAMLSDENGGLAIMNAIGSAESSMFSLIGTEYNALSKAQETQYNKQKWQAIFGAVGAGLGAALALGSTIYGITKWGSAEKELGNLKTARNNLKAEVGEDSKLAQVKDPIKEPEIKPGQESEMDDFSSVNNGDKELLSNQEENVPEVSVEKMEDAPEQTDYDPTKTPEENRINGIKEGNKAKVQEAQDKIGTRKQKLKEADEKIKEHGEKTKQMQNNVQGFQYFAQGASGAITKGGEAGFATQIGVAQANQTRADKMKTQVNVVYQAADQMYNRVVNNLDQDFQSLGSAAQQAESLKQRGASA